MTVSNTLTRWAVSRLRCRSTIVTLAALLLASCVAPSPAVTPTTVATRQPSQVPTAKPVPAAATATQPAATKESITSMTQQLIKAAEAGDTPGVLRLLHEGAEINGRDTQGRTAVMAATHNNQVATVQALIQAGADINIRDNLLDNPFLYAGAEGLLDILKLTIDAGADPTITNRFGGTALIPAAERGHIEIIKELLTRTDVDINHINRLGWTALLEAIILSDGDARHVDVVRLLIEAGADVHIADSQGMTPLAHARQRGQRQIVTLLEQAGAR